MQRFLIVNPRSGAGSPSAGGAPRRRARARHRRASSSRTGDDLPEVARRANADVLGMAGGDGSLAAVADVAIEQDIPFVCIPFGTRNHFARDIGLDRDDPIGALAAFDGEERRIDVGRVGEPPLPEQRLARPLRTARAPARAPPPPARGSRPPAGARADREGPPPPAAVHDRRRARARAARARREQRTTASTCSRSASASESTRDSSTCTSRTGSGASPGRSGAAPSSRSARLSPGSGPQSTASRWSSKRRFGSGSSRARYACCCRARQSERIST